MDNMLSRETGLRISPGAADEPPWSVNGATYLVPVTRGELEVGLYAPRGVDDQKPHQRDELYVIVRGTGEFAIHGKRHAFAPGDTILVPARVEHRFENFSDDFLTWVIFYGPPGGDSAEDASIGEGAVQILD